MKKFRLILTTLMFGFFSLKAQNIMPSSLMVINNTQFKLLINLFAYSSDLDNKPLFEAPQLVEIGVQKTFAIAPAPEIFDGMKPKYRFYIATLKKNLTQKQITQFIEQDSIFYYQYDTEFPAHTNHLTITAKPGLADQDVAVDFVYSKN